jgi:hypothetical protein
MTPQCQLIHPYVKTDRHLRILPLPKLRNKLSFVRKDLLEAMDIVLFAMLIAKT